MKYLKAKAALRTSTKVKRSSRCSETISYTRRVRSENEEGREDGVEGRSTSLSNNYLSSSVPCSFIVHVAKYNDVNWNCEWNTIA